MHQVILKTYGDPAVTYSQVFWWLKFKNNQDEVEDDPYSELPPTRRICTLRADKVKKQNCSYSKVGHQYLVVALW